MKDRFCKMVATLLTTSALLTGCIENIEYKEDYSAETVQTDTDIDTTEDTSVDTTEESARPSDPSVRDPAQIYAQAISFLDRGELQRAYDLFLTIRDYRNVEEYLSRFSFKCQSQVTRYPGYTHMSNLIYDSFGRVISHTYVSTHVDESFIISDTTQYSYHPSGHLAKQINSDGTVYTFEYDENGNNISQISSDGEEYISEYDENGNLIETAYKRAGDWYYSTFNIYDYDEYGRCVYHKSLGIGEPSSYTYTYEYDSNGNCIKRIFERKDIYENIEYSSCTYYTYDEKQNCIQKYTVYSDSDPSTIFYEYDDAGNKIAEREEWGSYRSEHFYTYDAKGNLIEEVENTSGNTTRTRSYEYDEKGNRIKETCMINHVVNGIIRRGYDSYGNLLWELYSHEDDVSNYVVTNYTRYRLYYNPYVVEDLPQGLNGLGGK